MQAVHAGITAAVFDVLGVDNSVASRTSLRRHRARPGARAGGDLARGAAVRGAAAFLALGLCAACGPASQPRLDAAVRVTPEGVRVEPTAAVRLGGVGVRVSR